MILGLRTDSADTTIALSDNEGALIDQKTWTAGRKLSEQLLAEIEGILTKNKKAWDDIQGIVVFAGPGSFTGLRIGITVANAIAYERKIKIVGAGGENWLAEGTKKLDSVAVGQIAVPEYGGEANITRPKR